MLKRPYTEQEIRTINNILDRQAEEELEKKEHPQKADDKELDAIMKIKEIDRVGGNLLKKAKREQRAPSSREMLAQMKKMQGIANDATLKLQEAKNAVRQLKDDNKPSEDDKEQESATKCP